MMRLSRRPFLGCLAASWAMPRALGWDGTGGAAFFSDVRLPGLAYAVVARPPVYGYRLGGARDSGAVTVPLPFDPAFSLPGGVAVVADSTWAALKALDRMRVDWQAPSRPIDPPRSVIEAQFHLRPIDQRSQEVPGATAWVEDGRCRIWSACPSSPSIRAEIARCLEIGAQEIAMTETKLSGGQRQRTNPAYAVEAALISQSVGRPVQLIWTPADDFPLRRFRAASGAFV